MINTELLSKSFGDTLAVDDLTFSVSAGEVFGLLGPNGAGKTTTIRLLSALIAPSRGSASVPVPFLSPLGAAMIRAQRCCGAQLA